MSEITKQYSDVIRKRGHLSKCMRCGESVIEEINIRIDTLRNDINVLNHYGHIYETAMIEQWIVRYERLRRKINKRIHKLRHDLHKTEREMSQSQFMVGLEALCNQGSKAGLEDKEMIIMNQMMMRDRSHKDK